MIKIYTLDNLADERGDSFVFLPEVFDFLGKVADVHISGIVPGAIRGNHYHKRKKEALAVLACDKWTFAWDAGENTSTRRREFSERGAILLAIEPGTAHAVKNTGGQLLKIFALSSEKFSVQAPDLYRKILLS